MQLKSNDVVFILLSRLSFTKLNDMILPTLLLWRTGEDDVALIQIDIRVLAVVLSHGSLDRVHLALHRG